MVFSFFWICALAECERLPFDLPEAEEELVAGYQTEYAGMKFALFYLAGYINLVLSAVLVSVLYLGGWGFPIPVEWLAGWLHQPIDAPVVQVITGSVGIMMTILKAYLLVFVAILLRWTTPRVRIDQLLDLGLEVPASPGACEPAGHSSSQVGIPCGIRRLNPPSPPRLRHHGVEDSFHPSPGSCRCSDSSNRLVTTPGTP